MSRTDCHRPGAIVPADYTASVCYAMPSEKDPGYGVDEARALCASVGWANDGRMFGHMGKCGVCGAWFMTGAIFIHAPTGDIVHMGQDCAAKYEVLATDDDFSAKLEAIKRGRAARIQAHVNRCKRADFLAAAPAGLAAILKVEMDGTCPLTKEALPEHYILRDLRGSFVGRCELSEKQIALAFKIAREEEARKNRPAEKMVAAPVVDGRVKVCGRVVSKKEHDGLYGTTIKITVKMETSEGAWLAWGTAPSSILYDNETGRRVEIGDTVEFIAALKQGRDAHFAIFSRPTKAAIVERGEKGRAQDAEREAVRGPVAAEDPFATFTAAG